MDPGPELPAEFVARLAALERALDAPLRARLASPPATVFRTNPLRGDAATTLAELRAAGLRPEPVAGLPDAFHVPSADRDALTHSAAATDGRLYVQGASSQRGARALGVRPGERVLDLAAAPGGKTLLLAAEMRDEGEIVAVEAIRERFYRLKDNLARAGVGCVKPVCLDGRRVPRAWDATFDRVLLDAPCSAEARFVPDDPTTWRRWSLRKVRDMARKQWGLLGAAIRCLKPGGTLVYATCAFSPEENEATLAAHVGRDDAEVELVPVALGDGVDARPGVTHWERKRWPDAVHHARRIVPDALHEGFFVACLRRRGPSAGVATFDTRHSARRG